MKHCLPLLLALLVTGCKCGSSDATPAGSSVRAPQESPKPRARPRVVRACTTLGVKGEARFAGKTVENGMRVDGSDFIELSDGARVTLKFDLTGREVTLIGPAVARGCNHGDSVVALSQGVVETARGAGTRPGVEGSIATTGAALTYGDASIRVRATGRETTIEVLQGEATLLGADENSEGTKLLPSTPATRVDASASAEAQHESCSKYAQRAAELARTVLRARAGMGSGAPSAHASTFATRAAEHVRVRRFARMHCAMAMATAGTVPAAERSAAAAKIVATDDVWRRVKPLR